MTADRRSNTRIRLLVFAFAAVFAVALGRAAWIQVVEGSSYEAMASKQHRQTIEIPAGRGTIYDRTGEPLAIGEQATTVYADPRNVVAPKKAAVEARKALGLDPDELYPHLIDRTKRFVFLERKADPVKARALQQLGIAGIGFYPEERRSYPQGRVASQLLGFAGTDNRGLEGLEGRSTRRSPASPVRGRRPRPRRAGDRRRHVPQGAPRAERRAHARSPAPGERRADPGLGCRPLGREGATAIVMDPRTGAILAMANAPTFDANDFSSAPPEERRNRAVTDLYEPGSTFKIVTVAAALEDNVVTPDTTFTLAPTINVADRVIREAHARGTEQMTVRQILAQSSNVGTITIAKDRLGGAELASWIDRFGFGERTGSELPGESAGLVLPYESWSGSTIGTVPIGQGIAVTPLQMVSAYAAIGNGGVMAPAHVVAKIGGKKVRHGKGRRVVSEHTADRMTAMFRNVVLEERAPRPRSPATPSRGRPGRRTRRRTGSTSRSTSRRSSGSCRRGSPASRSS